MTPNRTFHFVTISNRLDQYSAARESMATVGFNEENCRFTLLSNAEVNQFDPYQVLRTLKDDGTEPYYILCHQDLLFNPQTSYEKLLAAVNELNRRDDRWAVAGNAGISPKGERLLQIDDPTGSYRTKNLPRVVTTLDENFLLVRRSHAVGTSGGLSGFHFYGTDLCLNAIVAGRRCYVIDFPLKHLSDGKYETDYHESRAKITECWREKLWLGLIMTTTTEFNVSSNRIADRLIRSQRGQDWLLRLGWGIIPRWGQRRLVS